MIQDYIPVAIQIGAVLFFAVASILTSVILGKRALSSKAKDSAYECGKDPIGPANARFSVKFYLIAMLFILFDIETVFMYVWGTVYRDLLRDGLQVFFAMLSFVGILLVGYYYAIKKGAFDWAK